jgi:hypothetical protein
MSGLVGGVAELHKTLWVERTQKYDEEDARAEALYRRRTGKPMERYTPSSGNLWKVTLIHLTAAPALLIGSYYLETNGVDTKKYLFTYSLSLASSIASIAFKQTRNIWEFANHPSI